MSTQGIVMIGGGNMGRAIAVGLLNQGYPAQQIQIVEPDQNKAQALQEEYGFHCCNDFRDTSTSPDVVLMAVKPQIMRAVLETLGPQLSLNEGPLIISIAAGITTKQISRWLGREHKVVRVMPNTPAMVGAGASALFANLRCESADREVAETILNAVGMSVWVSSEDDIDAVTALSGSGPAYFFLMFEALESAGVALGLSTETARALALQTGLGAAKLATSSADEPSELRRQVTSPGGTTEKAIATLMDEGFPQSIDSALHAAFQRAKQLAAESEN
ncbi:MAG: pyrroline-5-carboxylate reductase [Pseudomonadota bacterium]